MFSANSSQVSDDKLFVEDVFSTYLYTGNSSTQTITNGTDLAGKGGLVWIKNRDFGSHQLYDTSRGVQNFLRTNTTGAQGVSTGRGVTAFNSNGFSVTDDANNAGVNLSGQNYASWTFREAPKFFDIVTWTGNGVAGDNNWRLINHALAATPGFIVVKRTDTASNWWTYHRGVNGSINGYLNLTNAFTGDGYLDRAYPFAPWNADTTKQFMVWNLGSGNDLNVNGATYVAYLYAHDAASDGIIQCGSYAGTSAAGNAQNLGWEPQWILIKKAVGGADQWFMFDNMRGVATGGVDATFYANSTDSESSANRITFNSTGFEFPGSAVNNSGSTYVYIAIRRGPMRTPTLGTSVFAPFATSLAVDTAITTNFPVDLMISGQRNSNNATDNWAFIDRLRGATAFDNTDGSRQKRIKSTSTSAEDSPTYPYAYNWWNTGLVQGFGLAGASQIYYTLRRAPGFFDEVCWTNTGATQNVNHNLGVVPELIITKRRPASEAWQVYSAATGASAYLVLNTTAAPITGNTNRWNATAPTSTVFTTGSAFNTAETYVAYLFASCPGVSKVGSYTGNGSSQTITCGFAAGARFVMIKRTDSTGDWYVWDSARGIVAGNDPYLALNDISAEVTTNDSVDTDSSGFVVNQVAATNVNVNAATYIYLAIA